MVALHRGRGGQKCLSQGGVRLLVRELGGSSRLKENKAEKGVELSQDRRLSGELPKKWSTEVRYSMAEGLSSDEVMGESFCTAREKKIVREERCNCSKVISSLKSRIYSVWEKFQKFTFLTF